MSNEENKLIESYIDEIAQFGDGPMEIQSKDLQQLVLIAKRESDARLKSQEDNERLMKLIRIARGTLGYGELETEPETILQVRTILDSALTTPKG